jgi:diguanylate cyclase (GGDEF)-like protein
MTRILEPETETWKALPTRPLLSGTRKAYLVHLFPARPGLDSLIHLKDAPVVLGRAESCDIRLNDLAVSRRHLAIQPEADGYYLVDLDSTNGTVVNGETIKRHKLKDGDHFQIGGQIFRYLTGANVEAKFLEEIYRLAVIDPLTGIYNKGFLMEFLTRELARSRRYGHSLALIMFDLDRFKEINDRLGHLGGDWALREFVGCIKGLIRKEELLARYGGEEFALVLLETDSTGAGQMAERLRQIVEGHRFVYEGQPFRMTISLGVAAVNGEHLGVPEDLIAQADAKLYEAKALGRNRVAV